MLSSEKWSYLIHSFTEIIEELPRLAPVERQILVKRLQVLVHEGEEKSSQLLLALEEARQSIRDEKYYTVEQARDLMRQWTVGSSQAIQFHSQHSRRR